MFKWSRNAKLMQSCNLIGNFVTSGLFSFPLNQQAISPPFKSGKTGWYSAGADMSLQKSCSAFTLSGFWMHSRTCWMSYYLLTRLQCSKANFKELQIYSILYFIRPLLSSWLNILVQSNDRRAFHLADLTDTINWYRNSIPLWWMFSELNWMSLRLLRMSTPCGY